MLIGFGFYLQCCAVCGLALLLLPFLLFPFYIHGESPMVLHLPKAFVFVTLPMHEFHLFILCVMIVWCRFWVCLLCRLCLVTCLAVM